MTLTRRPPPACREPLPPPLPPTLPPATDGQDRVLRPLALGVPLAIGAAFVLPSHFVWMLCALPHEMGHSTIGCLLGLPSAPAISLTGHAWTGHLQFQPWLVVFFVLALLGAAVTARRRPRLAATLGGAALLLPLCAFTIISEVLTLAGGHLGELLFAGYCFHHVVVGGKTGSQAERSAFAMAGMLVQFTNLRLTFGLLTSAAARAVYAGNGSLGQRNDFVRLSQDVFHCRLESVAFVMLLLSLLPLPLGLLLGCWRRARA